jgi:N-acetylglucosamine kinase-like BadF-type ATPase
MGLFLGIDGGGTTTSCVIGDEKSVLGAGTGGPSNVVRVGEAATRTALADAIGQACSTAGIDPSTIGGACVGIAGAARPQVAATVRKILAELISCEIEIVGDATIALQAAFGEGAGVVVIAGTGSVAYGRDASGRFARAGGWGFMVSDEGSGYWIGRTAVSAALRDADENPDSNDALLPAIMRAWNLNDRDGLVMAANASPAPDFAGLSPLVAALAGSGNDLAREILNRAGTELAAFGEIVVRRLFAHGDGAPVAMSGGVFRHSAVVRETFRSELRRQCPTVAIVEEMSNPVQGALERARK